MSEIQNSTVTILSKASLRAKSFRLDDALAENREAKAGLRKADESVMWNVSLLLGYALENGFIGKGEDTRWNTQGDYAADMGYSASSGTLLKRLSQAQAHGVRFGTKDWSFLTTHGTSARVGEVCRAESSEEFREGLKALQSEVASTGKIASKPGENRGKSSRKPGGETDQTDKAASVPPVPTVKDALYALHGVASMVKGFTADQWAEVEDALNKMVTSENHRRMLISQREAREAKKSA